MVRTDAGRDRDHGSNPLFHVFQDRNENPVSMNNIEGSEVEVEEAFDLEW